MSKKSRKKVARARKRETSCVGISRDKLADNTQAAVLPDIKTSTAKHKPATVAPTGDMKQHYRYVNEDLKHIALISIPMILGLVIASFFVKF